MILGLLFVLAVILLMYLKTIAFILAKLLGICLSWRDELETSLPKMPVHLKKQCSHRQGPHAYSPLDENCPSLVLKSRLNVVSEP